MTATVPLPDPEVAAEQAYLNGALALLGAMRQRAEQLLGDLIAAGNPDLDYVAALSRRVSQLANSRRPPLFGRIDEDEGPSWHIGRRHVEDTRWNRSSWTGAPPSPSPSTGPAPRDSLGLTRRRQIMVDREA